MVKIIGLSDKEIAEREKTSKLVGIAKEMFPKASIIGLVGLGITIALYKKDISLYVQPYRKEIVIDRYSQLEDAVKLAEKYEEKLGEEYTIKKNYSE